MKQDKNKIQKIINRTEDAVIVRNESLIMRLNSFEVLLDSIYGFFYILGINVLRRLSKYKRFTGKTFIR